VTEFVIRHIKTVSIDLNLTKKMGVIAVTAQFKPEFQAAQQEQRDENHGKKNASTTADVLKFVFGESFWESVSSYQDWWVFGMAQL
jgi:hypothetical protein